MSKPQYIYWDKERKTVKGVALRLAHVHMLVGYNQGCLADFQEMTEELRKTFPQAKAENIGCGRVTRSSSVDGFTIITWSGYIAKKKYPGFYSVKGHNPEYQHPAHAPHQHR